MLINITTYDRVRDALTKEPTDNLTLDLAVSDPIDFYSVGAAFVDHAVGKSEVLRRFAVERGVPIVSIPLSKVESVPIAPLGTFAATAKAGSYASEQPVSAPISHYIGEQRELLIAAALRHYAKTADCSATEVDEANNLAHALTNDTWLLETATDPAAQPAPAPNDLERLAAEFQALRAKGVSGPLADDVMINGVSYVVSIDTEEDEKTTRQHKIDWLVADAVNSAESRKDLGWYVREHFERLDEGDLEREFIDAGGDEG